MANVTYTFAVGCSSSQGDAEMGQNNFSLNTALHIIMQLNPLPLTNLSQHPHSYNCIWKKGSDCCITNLLDFTIFLLCFFFHFFLCFLLLFFLFVLGSVVLQQRVKENDSLVLEKPIEVGVAVRWSLGTCSQNHTHTHSSHHLKGKSSFPMLRDDHWSWSEKREKNKKIKKESCFKLHLIIPSQSRPSDITEHGPPCKSQKTTKAGVHDQKDLEVQVLWIVETLK